MLMAPRLAMPLKIENRSTRKSVHTLPSITLKPGKDIPLRAGHPWVFSNAIATDASTEPGELVEVKSSNGQPLGIGTRNSLCDIRVRMLSHDVHETIDAAFFTRRFKHLDAWKRARLPDRTNGYRLVHAEADWLPGLIVDRYVDCFVFQIHTAGMERLRQEIIAGLIEAFNPSVIVERSDLDVRKIEGLYDRPITIHRGEVTGPISFQETGLTFFADVLKGQKTGFFLDQRDARRAVGQLSKGRRVLNLFGYTGAFSLHAAMQGASFVTTADISHHALEQAEQNFKANNLDPQDESRFLFLEADVVELMHDPKLPGGPYDVIICDPPAFAKSARNLPQAIKAYTDLNAACVSQLDVGGILVSSSCSGRLDPEEFRSMLRIAAGRAGRDLRLIDWINHPIDHAERIAFPEGRYLKTAILEVTEIL